MSKNKVYWSSCTNKVSYVPGVDSLSDLMSIKVNGRRELLNNGDINCTKVLFTNCLCLYPGMDLARHFWMGAHRRCAEFLEFWPKSCEESVFLENPK